ncbi:hypothetical protein [Humisphaera borealis]|uniref:Uncharacterized protein n=1 Tax=Humisphaera borealis TaxID=2807512 RepID=A0A7M2WZU7_9BACT|nr:hypothetical protein [Humisphaera borealis]QOV90959.1 hypothetical protein IPV69_06250 [Humisphaera borealis]
MYTSPDPTAKVPTENLCDIELRRFDDKLWVQRLRSITSHGADYMDGIADSITESFAADRHVWPELTDPAALVRYKECSTRTSWRAFADIRSGALDPSTFADAVMAERTAIYAHLLEQPSAREDIVGFYSRRVAYTAAVYAAAAIYRGHLATAVRAAAALTESIATCPRAAAIAGMGMPLSDASETHTEGKDRAATRTKYIYLLGLLVPLDVYRRKFLADPYGFHPDRSTTTSD